MGMEKLWWLRSKTFWAMVTAIIGALAGLATGEIAVADALQIIVSALIGFFVRSGVEGLKGHNDQRGA